MPLLHTIRRWLSAPVPQAGDLVAKAATAQTYIRASMSQGDKRHDGKPQPFNGNAAVAAYSSWIYAAATINAQAVAANPLRMYVRSRGTGAKLWNTRAASRKVKRYLAGDSLQQPSQHVMRKAAELGADFEEVTDSHPLMQLLARSNPYTNGFDLAVLRVVWQELTGNAYMHIVTNEALGVPSELWPMPPQWTRIVPDEQNYIAAFQYGRSSESSVRLEPSEVLHFKRPNPRDLFYGMGKLEAAWGAAEANAALHEMDLAFFANHARPDYALVVKGNASDEQLDGLEQQIQAKLRGNRKTGHFLVTTADIDLKPMQFPSKDLEGREEIVEEIAAVFGVPVSMLKANDPNLASAEAGFSSWREMTVLPLCRMDEEVLNQRLLPLFGLEDDAVLAYDNPVPANRVQDLTERQAAVANGWMTPNEAREQQGLEPIVDDPHADMLHVNGQPLGGTPMAMPYGAGVPLPADTAPAASPTPEPDTAPQADDATVEQPADAAAQADAVADTALNGAQIQSLVDMATAVQAGELPKEAARAIARASFPTVATEQLDAIFDPITPMAPAAPAQADAQQAAAPAPVRKPEPQPGESLDDCVARGIAKLLQEGYDQEQATAIAISMCGGAKALEDIDTVPPQQVADNARRALEVREAKPASQRGMTEVGLARARDLQNRVALSEETIRRMVAYFERHESDKQGESWDEQGPGWQAWMGWGGDEGWDWAARKVAEFDREREAAKSCGCSHVKSHREWWLAHDQEALAKADTGALVNDELLERWLSGTTSVLRTQVQEVVRAIKAGGGDTTELVNQVTRLLRSAKWNRDLTEALQPYLARALEGGAALGMDTLQRVAGTPAVAQLGWSSQQLEDYVARSSTTLAQRAAASVNGYTEARVRDLLGDGLAKGETVGELADRVQAWAEGADDAAGDMTRRRATTIARTEAARAASTANQDAWRATGLVTGKRWELAPDACEFCSAAAKAYGKAGVPLDQPFYSQGETLAVRGGGSMNLDFEDVQGPPLHPNCRCAMLPVLADDFEDIAAEAERRIRG